jgi:hypothetical protein
MPDNKELAREIKALREKVRDGEDVALAERRRNQELTAAYSESRSQRAQGRGF